MSYLSISRIFLYGNNIISGASIVYTENNITTPKDPNIAIELY